jgi:hypothetical protein
LKKANPLPADGIDIRGADIRAAETAYIAIAQIVGKDQDHVRPGRRCGRRGRNHRARALQEVSPIQRPGRHFQKYSFNAI